MLFKHMEQSCEYVCVAEALPALAVRFCNLLCVVKLSAGVSTSGGNLDMPTTYLNVFSLFCQPRFNSSLILTQRNIISSPPLKSMPSCTMSPSFMGNGFDSVPGGLSRIWLRKVPELLLTSLMYHLPPSYQNSQCRLLTTLLLNPTGASDGTFGGTFGWLSRSE